MKPPSASLCVGKTFSGLREVFSAISDLGVSLNYQGVAMLLPFSLLLSTVLLFYPYSLSY